MILKWLSMPFSNRTKQVQVAQLWEVRWKSLKGDIRWPAERPEMEAFTNESEADEFVTALENAVKLLRHAVDYEIDIQKGKAS